MPNMPEHSNTTEDLQIAAQVSATPSGPSDEAIAKLADSLMSAVRRQLTGTLQAYDAEDRLRQFFFCDGLFRDADLDTEETLLETALLRTECFSERDIRKAQKLRAKSERGLSEILLELDRVTEEGLVDSIHEVFVDGVTDLFNSTVRSEFFEHDEDERLEGFESELSECMDVPINTEDVFLAAARRIERWDLVRRHFPILRDVYSASVATFRYIQEKHEYPEENLVVSAVDGSKDVEEVIDATGLDPFDALTVIHRLIRRNELELVNPVQMYQIGVEFAANGYLEKSCKLFIRAHERGLDDFDLQLNVAQTLARLGRVNEASRWYTEFAEKCLEQHRHTDAIRSFKRATELSPRNIDIHERYVNVLLKHEKVQEAAEEAISLVNKKADCDEQTSSLELLLEIRSQLPKDLRLTRKIIEVAEGCGEYAIAAREKGTLKRSLDLMKDTDAALEFYQQLYCDGDTSLEVRLKLLQLHRVRNHKQRALEHAYAVLNLPDNSGPRHVETISMLHEVVRDLNPIDYRSSVWLVEYHLENGEDSEAIEILHDWIENLKRESRLEEVEIAYGRLLALEDTTENRWGFATALEQLGCNEEYLGQLYLLAKRSADEENSPMFDKALEALLKNAPFHLEARQLRAEFLKKMGRTEESVEEYRKTAVLHSLAGNVQEAETFTTLLLGLRPDDANLVETLGELCLRSGDEQKAIEQFLKAARIHLQKDNFGMCGEALNRVLKAQPGNSEAVSMSEELKNAVARTSANASAPSQDFQRVPFSDPPSPRTTGVAGITARLKQLKGGQQSNFGRVVINGEAAEDDRESDSAENRPVVPPETKKVSSITARLRALKGGRAERPKTEPDVTQDADAGAPAHQPQEESTENVSDITARLKALKAGGGRAERPNAEPDVTQDADAGAPAHQPQEESTENVSDITARLKALKAGRAGAGAAGESSEVEAPEAPAGNDAEGPAPLPEPSEDPALTKEKLGGAINRLAALRKKS